MKRSLRLLLSVYAGLTIGVSLLIFAIVVGISSMTSVGTVTAEKYLENTNVYAERIAGWFDTQIRTVDSYVEAIKACKLDTVNFDKAEDFLAEIVDVDPSVYAIYMGRPDKSGVFSDRWDAEAEGYDPTTREWYIDAVATDDAVISAPYNDVGTNQQVITISKAIKDDSGNLAAVLASDIFVTSVVDMTNEIADGDMLYPILLDAYNNIVVHKDPMFIPMTDESGNDVITNIEVLNVPMCLTAEDNTYFETADYDGVQSIFTKQQIGETGWHLLTAIPKGSFYMFVNELVMFYGALTLFFIALSICTMSFILNKRLRPLAELTVASNAMLAGELSYTSEYREDNEIGKSCIAVETALKKISSYVSDIDMCLRAMAEGDFTYESNLDYIGDFVNIKNSLMTIQNSLRETFGNIKALVNDVATGAHQLTQAAGELSNGAISQASSIDMLTGSLAETTDIVNTTAHNATEANKIANNTNESVNICSSSMSDLVETMNRIVVTSEEINKINKTIEDIAYQTYILSLNASVEAARAGEAGKGFAVVADEVRNLATKSSAAAASATQLILESSEAIEKGKKYTDMTAEALNTLIEGTKQTINLISEITEDTVVEKEKLDAVTNELSSISAVVQTNTATAEETAAASNSLQSQAVSLNDKISQFRC